MKNTFLAKRIDDLKLYESEFHKGIRKEAFKCAHEIREYENSQYWIRAGYFWALLAATFAGYFGLIATDKNPEPSALLTISCIGLVLSVAWYLVNRGSKYWQVNWERHVYLLEDEFVGPLYKTRILDDEFKWYSLYGAYPFSVSKINCLTSFFVMLVWLGLTLSFYLPDLSMLKPYCKCIVGLATGGVIILVLPESWCLKGGFDNDWA